MKKYLTLIICFIGTLLAFSSCADADEKDKPKDVRVVMETSKGDIHLTVFASKTPVTAANFLNLAKRGYYNNVSFHRVIPDFMIQGGDPTGTGMGTPGYAFEDEIVPELKHNKAGILSMANTGRPVSNGSQFFITHGPTPHLDGKHTVFGEVTQGQDVVNSIKQGDVIKKIKFIDSPEPLLKDQAKRVSVWNALLDAKKES